MLLCLTKKVQELFHISDLMNYPESDQKMWHVTFELHERKKLYVFTQTKTGYSLIFYGLKTKHLKNIEPYFKESIKALLLIDGFTSVAADAFIEFLGHITYGRTNNRSIIANTTHIKHYMYSYLDYLNPNEIFQKMISHRTNQLLGVNDFTPRENLEKVIQTLVDVPNSYTGYELDITIDLEGAIVSRRVIVPNYYTLDDLHIVIQKAFGWKNMHLHDFTNKNSNEKYVLHEDLNEDIDTRNTKWISLDDAFKHFDEWLYTYDFGEDWQHHIFCRMSIHQKNPIKSFCSAYEGENIPEDVGGIPGYLHFIEVMKSKNHKEYQSYKNWLDVIEYEPFNHDYLNISLIEEWPLGFKSSLLKLFDVKKKP